jgi:hypothetical protein
VKRQKETTDPNGVHETNTSWTTDTRLQATIYGKNRDCQFLQGVCVCILLILRLHFYIKLISYNALCRGTLLECIRER